MPPPDATYAPWTYVRGPDGKIWYAPGAWHDAKGAVLDAPPALAVAVVDTGEVVNATGQTERIGRPLRPGRKNPDQTPTP
jgi:hypothetical protein